MDRPPSFLPSLFQNVQYRSVQQTLLSSRKLTPPSSVNFGEFPVRGEMERCPLLLPSKWIQLMSPSSSAAAAKDRKGRGWRYVKPVSNPLPSPNRLYLGQNISFFCNGRCTFPCNVKEENISVAKTLSERESLFFPFRNNTTSHFRRPLSPAGGGGGEYLGMCRSLLLSPPQTKRGKRKRGEGDRQNAFLANGRTSREWKQNRDEDRGCGIGQSLL